MNRSQGDPELRFTRKWTPISTLDETLADKEVLIRGRLHNSRAKGKACFIIIRDQASTVQAAMFVSEILSKGMIEFARKIPKESIIDIKAIVVVPTAPVDGCTQKIELKVLEIWTVNRSVPMLPF